MISSRTTAAADARPVLLNWKASLTVWITKVSVPVAPPVMMYGISKTDREPEIERITLRLRTGRIPGAMMYRNWCQRLAPSSSAASYSSPGIDWIAPRKSTKFRPM